MSPYEQELRECLGIVLGYSPPMPEYDAFLFFRQWLAERNLGLVPIANARGFDWPGHWLARFGRRTGIMRSSCSGRRPGRCTIRAVRWPPAARSRRAGCSPDSTCAFRSRSRTAGIGVSAVERAEAVAGRGLEGDRYFDGRGTFSGPGHGYQVTLVEAEVLDSIDLPWEQARRNIVTRGIALNALVGRRFTVGPVECVGRRLAEPCSHLERLTRSGLLRPLVHRAGLRADILESGSISTGDQIAAAD